MLSTNEQLAALTALQKMVKARLDEVRAEADDAMHDAYVDDGVTKKALKIGGAKVGDYIVVLTKDGWEIEDTEAFNDFALTYGFASIRQEIAPGCMAQAVSLIAEAAPELLATTVAVDPHWQDYITNMGGRAAFMDSGETVPGLTYVQQHVKGTQVRGCKPEDVVPAIRSLGGIDQLLLGAPATETDIH